MVSSLLRRILNRIERGYRALPQLRIRWIVLAAALALTFSVSASIWGYAREQPLAIAVFNGLTSYMRALPLEPLDPHYYRAQVAAFERQFYRSVTDARNYDLLIDPSELHRVESVFDDRRDQQDLWSGGRAEGSTGRNRTGTAWARFWHPQGERKTGIAFLRHGENLYPVHIRVRGEGTNHMRGPLKSWRVSRIALPGAPDWPFPSETININLPEYNLMEWLAMKFAARAGLDTYHYEPAILYLNGVYQGVRLTFEQPGPAYMRSHQLPIGFLVDPRIDRWDTLDPAGEAAMQNYRFGDVRTGGDLRDLRYPVAEDDLVSLFTFFILYRTLHIVDLRFYVDPLYRKVVLIPWNLEDPSPARRFSQQAAHSRALYDISSIHPERLVGIDHLFGQVIYPRLTPEIIFRVFERIYRLTRSGQPLDLQRLRADYAAIEEKFRKDFEAFPYWYGVRDFNFNTPELEKAAVIRDETLFGTLEDSYSDAIAQAERLELSCSFARNLEAGAGILGALECMSPAPSGALIEGIDTQGGGWGDELHLVWDRNLNGMADPEDRLIGEVDGERAGGRSIRFLKGSFHVLNDGRELHPFTQESVLNRYRFLFVSPTFGAAPSAVRVVHPLTETTAEVAVSFGEDASFAIDTATDFDRLAIGGADVKEAAGTEVEASSLPAFVRLTGPDSFEIPGGRHRLTSSMALPLGAELRIAGGAELTLEDGSYIYQTGPLTIDGSAENPVRLVSLGQAGSAGQIIVNHTGPRPSILKHFTLEGGGDVRINEVDYAGALTILGAEFLIEDCRFTDSRGQAALSLRWARGGIERCEFEDAGGNSVVYQNSSGTLANSRFDGAGGHAVIVDDSNVAMRGLDIRRAEAAVLSVGGRSYSEIRSSRLSDGPAAIEVKDDGHLDIVDTTLSDSEIGLHIHLATDGKNSMTAALDGVTFSGIARTILKDPGTPERSLTVTGRPF